MNSGRLVILTTIILIILSPLNGKAKEEPIFHTWEVQIPVMAHLAVSMNGTVLLFREERDKGSIEVKRSEDGGKNWGEFLVVGKRVDLDADMSDDGRYKGDHVGWSELANVIVDETSGDILVFAGGLKPAQILYRSKDNG